MDEVIGFARTIYIWKCPDCDYDNATDYIDVKGSIKNCALCGEEFIVKD